MKTKSKNRLSLLFKPNYLLLLPNFLLVTIVPLIVFLKIIPVDQSIVQFYDNRAENQDFFSYFKSIWIIVLSAFSIITIIISITLKKYKSKKTYGIYIPIAIYLFCIILSTVMSKYPHTAIFGFPDRYEGLLVLLCYIAAFITTINLTNSETQIKMLLAGIMTAASIISIIGLFQYIGLDFFNSRLGRFVILASEYSNTTATIKTSSETSSAIYSTLYNPNNLGMYMCMVFSISLCIFLLSERKQIKVISCILSCLIFVNLLGSNSRGSYIGAFVSVLLIILLTRKLFQQKWKSLLGIFTIYLLMGIGFNSLSGSILSTKLESLFSMRDLHSENKSIDKIKSFDINENQLSLHCTNSLLKIIVNGSELSFCDDNNNSLSLISAEQEKGYTLKADKYRDYLILISDNLLKVQKGKSYLLFAIKDNNFLYLNNRGEVVKSSVIETFGFTGMERLGSGRGYIWSRTLPLLKETILLGHGPDTFAMFFPQNDYIGKLSFMYDANITIDKPHNTYLQTAVNTGVLSLLALLFVFAAYWITSIRLLIKSDFNDFYNTASLCVLSAISSYMVSSLFADSTVSVSPTFWVLLGIGIGINWCLSDKVMQDSYISQ